MPTPKSAYKSYPKPSSTKKEEEGINLLLQALTIDPSERVRDMAYYLLLYRHNKSIRIIEVLKAYKPVKSISPWYLEHSINGHSKRVNSLAFSPDNKTLASGSSNISINLWDLADGWQVASGDSDWLHSQAFSPNGKSLACSSTNHTIKLWNVTTHQEIATLTGHSNRVNSVAFSPDSGTLASASDDKTIKLWDIATRQEISTFTGHSNRVNSVAFSPDSGTLASGSDDNTIKLWDIVTRREISTLTGHAYGVLSAAFSPDGKTKPSPPAVGTTPSRFGSAELFHIVTSEINP